MRQAIWPTPQPQCSAISRRNWGKLISTKDELFPELLQCAAFTLHRSKSFNHMAGHLRHNLLGLSKFCRSSMSACADWNAEAVSSFHKLNYEDRDISLQRAHAMMSLQNLQPNERCRVCGRDVGQSSPTLQGFDCLNPTPCHTQNWYASLAHVPTLFDIASMIRQYQRTQNPGLSVACWQHQPDLTHYSAKQQHWHRWSKTISGSRLIHRLLKSIGNTRKRKNWSTWSAIPALVLLLMCWDKYTRWNKSSSAQATAHKWSG